MTTDPTPALSPAEPIPVHLQHFPGLWVRSGAQVLAAPDADVAVARGYPIAADKGAWIDGRRITILAAPGPVASGQPVRVVHVVESIRAGDALWVMGPKVVLGEQVDGALATAAPPASRDPLAPTGIYDGRRLPAPAVDYNYDITEYRFAPGRHTIVWELGELRSNEIAIDVAP